MMPPDFLYFLMNAKGKFYRYKNRQVDDTTSPAPLPITPDGWQDQSIKWMRNMDVFGIFRSFTVPLKFVKQVATILRSRFYTAFTEDQIFLVINWLDKSFGGGWVHRLFFYGELDLVQGKDNDQNFTVNIMEGGLVKFWNAFKGVEYPVILDGPTVRMDGLKLLEKINYTVLDLEIGPSEHTIGVISPNREGPGIGVLQGDSPLKNLVGFTDVATDEDRWIEKSVDQTFINVIEGKLSIEIPNGPDIKDYGAHYQKSDGSIYDIIPFGPITNGVHTFDIHLSIPMLPGEKIFIFGAYGAGLPASIKYLQTDFSFTYFSQYKATYVKAKKPVDVAQSLLDSMTGGGYTFVSNTLSQDWDNLLLISGDGLRGLDGAVIKTSMDSFFKSYNLPANLEAHIDGKNFVIEKKEKAFGQAVTLNLGEAESNTFECGIAADMLCNTLEIGYDVSDNTTYESVNGRGTFNSTSKFTSSVTKVNKVLEIKSDYIASCAEIELIRINLDNKTTVDTNTDNKNYFLHVEKNSAGIAPDGSPYFNLLRIVYDSVTGVINPANVFNVELSPMRCLLRHGNYLRSIFYFVQGTKLIFQTSAKNSEMSTTKNGVTISENADVTINTLDAPLFAPFNFKSKNSMSREIVNVMKNQPMETFAATRNGKTYFGYPTSVSIQPTNNPSQETILLCNPITDLTQFIV